MVAVQPVYRLEAASFALWAVRAGCSVKRDLSTASAHLVLNFRDAAPPSPLGVLANATPRRFPLRLITGNLSSGSHGLRRGRGAGLHPHPAPLPSSAVKNPISDGFELGG